MSTAMTDSPNTERATSWPLSKTIFGRRHAATTPGLRAKASSTSHTPNGINMAAMRTGNSCGSVTKKTMLGTK